MNVLEPDEPPLPKEEPKEPPVPKEEPKEPAEPNKGNSNIFFIDSRLWVRTGESVIKREPIVYSTKSDQRGSGSISYRKSKPGNHPCCY